MPVNFFSQDEMVLAFAPGRLKFTTSITWFIRPDFTT